MSDDQTGCLLLITVFGGKKLAQIIGQIVKTTISTEGQS